ncbi:MAG: BlaI/MecI/CopY family transcriptional regulator [Steroidobacteraceae bacterium]
MSSRLPALGDLEHELLTLLWKHGAMTAVAVRRALHRDLKDPTIRTVLRRLEEKGYVTHKVERGTFIYTAKESQERAAARAVKGIVDKFCGGSLERLLLGLVEASVIQPKQLDALVGKVSRALKAR